MNKKHLYCTIGVGENYFNSALNMASMLNGLSNNHHFLIVTDSKTYDTISHIWTLPLSNTTIEILPDSMVLFSEICFNYMLKYYPMYKASELNYEYVIYIDSDWRIRPTYDENNINKLFEFMETDGYDVIFERPYWVGSAKTEGRNCIFYHKIDFYKLLETDEYDEAHACNEQILIFKNNDKFKVFVNKFKELHDICTEAKLWPFAEGLEMGMSMVTAKMRYTWHGLGLLKNMYEFNSQDGRFFIRF
jgi:hypothetical protein